MRIWNIASIQSGYFLRTEAKGSAVYLQAKHFDDNGDLKEGVLVADLEHDVKDRHLLKWDDILFVAKGTRSFATVYKEILGPCVASSTFFVIRLHSKILVPEYLALILNQSQNRAYLRWHFSWSTVPSIPKSVLEEFEMPIPPKETQIKLVRLHELYKQTFRIQTNIQEKKLLLIGTLILKASH